MREYETMFIKHYISYYKTRLLFHIRNRGILQLPKIILAFCLINFQRIWKNTQKQNKKSSIDTDSFDQIYEMDTSGYVGPHCLDNKDSENWASGNAYMPTPTLWLDSIFDSLDSIFESLEIDFLDYSFVDLGSGKGRVLLTASRFPFRNIVGVEYAADLHLSAINNLKMIGKMAPKCKNITALHMDVLNFEIPEEATVIYLYNSFQEPIVHKLIDKIEQSLHRKFRDIFIIYVVPMHSDIFNEINWLEHVNQAGHAKIYRTKSGYFSS